MKALCHQYGGQAVIDGVMMRGRHQYAVAVRKPDQEIAVHLEECRSPADRISWLRWPFFRGALALYEALYIGFKALNYSADQAIGEEEEFSIWEIGLTFTAAFIMAILIFVVPPAMAVNYFGQYIQHFFWLNLIEGAFKALLFLLYILAISSFKDIRQVFAYHGAEHKVLHAYEKTGSFAVDDVRKYSPVHPRCGTSFLLLVILVSVLLFSFFGRPPVLLRIGIHLALLPVVSSLSYEILRLSGRKQGRWWADLISAPGLLLQRLTTREPTRGQLEVAAAALKELLAAEGVIPLRASGRSIEK